MVPSELRSTYRRQLVWRFYVIAFGEAFEPAIDWMNQNYGFNSPDDYRNANLMILLGYIILGHPDWKKGHIKIFALYPEKKMEEKRKQLMELIKTGRLPISPSNILMVSFDTANRKTAIKKYSADADLTIIGFTSDALINIEEFSEGYHDLGNILYVNSSRAKAIN